MIKRISMLALIVSGYASISYGMEGYKSSFPAVETLNKPDCEPGTFEKALMQSIIDNIEKPEAYFETFMADLSRFVGQWQIDYDVKCWVKYSECGWEESFGEFIKSFGEILSENKNELKAGLISERAERIKSVIDEKQYAYSSRHASEPIPLNTFSDQMQIPRQKGWWKKHVKPTVLGIISMAITAIIIAAVVHKLRTRKIHRSMRTV